MKTIKCKLTVYFAEPFWVGVFERICDGKLSVAKVTFGAEPKDYDIQEFVLKFVVKCFTLSAKLSLKKREQ